MEKERILPKWMIIICGFTTLSSIIISILGIILHLKNYRKPFEQRLIIRILTLVPLFCISCYLLLINYRIGAFIESIREIYEAFTIYTFYKLLVLMLGGERKIIISTVDQEPISHPFPLSLILRKVNISDPQHFLTIKRCILQYVWVKPLLYIIILITSILGIYDVNDISPTSVFVWVGLCYNISVSTSLYSLAMFWRCLYDQLKIFDPWRKFLCVKLIIFASYWQGLIIGLLNWIGVFKENDNLILLSSNSGNLGIQIQNGLLCFEMIFFAILHWNSFPYSDFSIDKFPDAARMKTWTAFKDWINIGDLMNDIKITTIYGDSYNLRNFDSMADSRIYNSSDTFNQKIYQGLRISASGKKYWMNISDDGTSLDMPSNVNETNNSVNKDIYTDGNNNKNYYTEIFSNNSLAKESIENKMRVLLGNSNDYDTFNKQPQHSHNNLEPMNLMTPLLNSTTFTTTTNDNNNNNNNSNIERRYVTDIDDIFDESNNLIINGNSDYNNEEQDLIKDERLYRYVKTHYLTEDIINYPVEYDYNLIDNSSRINKLRNQVRGGKNLDIENYSALT